MGKPRMIIVIRHAQSEGNKNRSIHQTTPDHRVKLTPDGWQQAIEAGRRLRSLLRPDDTLQFYTSPYRRTRETTEGILKELTSDNPDPSPFRRHAVKVWEEPRLREQDFGNFQPNSKEMERMWKERAEYGHFFYRIPNGESAADAYDRVSGFNETLWRQFAEDDFPSVCVLVTHGLMTRVFLMKWYHWSIEYFEDLRNVNHCEFVIMERSKESGKFILKNELRTWSELKRERAIEAEAAAAGKEGQRGQEVDPLEIPTRKRWGSAVSTSPLRRTPRKDSQLAPQPAEQGNSHVDGATKPIEVPDDSAPADLLNGAEDDDEAFPEPRDPQVTFSADALSQSLSRTKHRQHIPSYIEAGRDFGGSASGTSTPMEGVIEAGGYGFPLQKEVSGWNTGARADALGDHANVANSLEEQEEHDKSVGGSVF